MTVLEVLTAATDYLGKQGVESPRLNAEHLLAHVLGKKNRIELYLEFERPLGETERAPLRDLVRQRADGRPLQHLLGTVEFLGFTFATDARALIPRPETEQLVELVLASGDFERVLDVGTGSGVIALSLALKRPQSAVTGCDISPEALALASENATRHELAGRVQLIESDLLANTPGPVDVIVANLPYIPEAEFKDLSREVGHDPVLALAGGADGLDLIRHLVAVAPAALSPGGLLALEIGHDQAARVCELLQANNYRDISPRRDYQNIERFIIARHG
ncbi:MAG: peptide chain release factor N(5)-glutamine methyltransferase [Verrucomicrobia bacterium]|nr:peptide chain release factor N(5)-glutamine methyltransferase [Verrucomicrobiota bacterium]